MVLVNIVIRLIMGVNILDFPDELIERILEFCDLMSLNSIMRTCKRFNDCSTSEGLWRTKLCELAQSANIRFDSDFWSTAHDYKSVCLRFCSIFGLPHFSDHSELRCSHCHGICCDSQCLSDNEEMIVFDFGSKTTWLKYTSESTGQISMHPTVIPSVLPLESVASSYKFDSSILDGESCPVCTKIIMQGLQQGVSFSQAFSITDESSDFAGRKSGVLSKLPLRSLNCWNPDGEADNSSADNDESLDEENFDVTDVIEDKRSPNAETDVDAGEKSEAFSWYKTCSFLVRHMLKRNPFFRVSTIPFVICEPVGMKLEERRALIEMLLCDLKIPGVCIVPKSVAVALYTGLDTCLVVDSGSKHTTIMSIVELMPQDESARTVNCGGAFLSDQLLECLWDKGLLLEVPPGGFDATQVKRECYLAYNFESECKKKLSSRNVFIKSSVDGKQKITEVALSHVLYVLPEEMYLSLGLPQLILSSISSLPFPTQKRLLTNIILTGGNCRLTGLSLRLSADLQNLLPPSLSPFVRVVDPRLMTGRSDVVIGASYVKRWPQARWTTRLDYIMDDSSKKSTCASS